MSIPTFILRTAALVVVVTAGLGPVEPTLGQTPDVLAEKIFSSIDKTEMMAEFLKKQALKALDRRDEAFERLADDELTIWQEEKRAFFLKQLGGFPKRHQLFAKITGEIQMAQYRIEKLYFQSQPGLHVSANLYLPKGQGPFPAVLHPTGHSATAKNRELYQQASIAIAMGGCAVLCYDPIGQGERQQILQGNGKPYSSTQQHMLINQADHLMGGNIASTMIWDGIRAIDYLQSRPDILPQAIGCVGISGGGTNTSYLMALDPRIKAAAPGCYLTGFRSLLQTIGPQDAEQNIHGQIAFGMDHADYVLMRLPQPTLIMAATDDYFDIRGAWDLFRSGKRFATRLGYPERVDLVEANTGHGFPKEMRVSAGNWMRRWLLKIDDPIVEGELKSLDEKRLNVTPNGRVLDLPGARSIMEINAEKNRQWKGRRQENADPIHRNRLLSTVRHLIGARSLVGLPQPVIRKSDNGYIIEPEPGIQLPALFSGDKKATQLVVFLHENGKGAALQSDHYHLWQKQKNVQLLAVDLRGLGETQKKAGNSGFDELFGADWKETLLASLLEKTYVGMRTEDIWQVVRAWRNECKNQELRATLIAVGEPAIPALHAACLETQLFDEIHLVKSIDSWTAIVENPITRKQQSNLVFGALREYDLPMLRSLIEKKLTWNKPVRPDGTPPQ